MVVVVVVGRFMVWAKASTAAALVQGVPVGEARSRLGTSRYAQGDVICPFCGHNDDKVIDSRASEAGKVIRRRRECLNAACKRRFTTYERVEELARLTVVKRDGTRVPFSRDNILRGVQAACGKRPVPEAARVALVDEVEEAVYREFEREVPSKRIGELVCNKLRDLDEVAYIRFASEHRQFKDAGDIANELAELGARVRDAKDQAKLF